MDISMTNIFSLPLELLFTIFDNCTLYDLLIFEQVCKKSRYVCSLWWDRLATLDVKSAISAYNTDLTISPDKLIYFLQLKAYKIEHLSFKQAPFHLTMSSLIRISSVCERIKILDLTQIPVAYSSIDASYVLALPYFRNLHELNIELELPTFAVGRKCLHRHIDMPFHLLSVNLKRFSFLGTGISVTKMLQTMRERGQKLNNLENLNLIIRFCISSLIEELAWFLDFHPNLQSLILENVVFTSMTQILMFMRVIQRHPSLIAVKLENSACAELTDPKTLQKVYDQIEAQQIQLDGNIFSFRYAPQQ